MPAYLKTISEFVANLRYEDLPPEVVKRARLVCADTLAVMAAGSQEAEVKALAERLEPAPGPATVWGLGRRAQAGQAALLGGIGGTFLELDEGNQFARGHPAIHVLPAAWALGEARRLGGKALITALVAGYEIASRIGMAAKLRMSMHPHGTWGTVGAAVAAGSLAGLGAADMARLINISSSLGLATSRQTMLQGGTVRNTYAGLSNQLGLLALDLCRSGFTGEADGLGTIYGSVVSETFDPAVMTHELGIRWEIARNYFKRHACCRYNHSALDALGAIAARFPGGRVPVDQVTRVEVQTYSLAAQLSGQHPDNMLAAKFSIPFAVATSLVHGATGLECFRAHQVNNPVTQELAGRVSVTEAPALTAQMPDRRPSRVRLWTTDGQCHEAETSLNKGDFEDPYGEAELKEKYFELAGPVWGDEKAAALRDGLLELEKTVDLNALSAPLD